MRACRDSGRGARGPQAVFEWWWVERGHRNLLRHRVYGDSGAAATPRLVTVGFADLAAGRVVVFDPAPAGGWEPQGLVSRSGLGVRRRTPPAARPASPLSESIVRVPRGWLVEGLARAPRAAGRRLSRGARPQGAGRGGRARGAGSGPAGRLGPAQRMRRRRLPL